MVVKGRWLAAHMTSGPAPQLGKSNFSRLKLFLSPNSPSNVRVYTTCTCWRCLIRRESVKEVDIRSSTWCIHRVGCDSVLQTYIYYAGEDARVASHALWHCVEMVLAPVHKKKKIFFIVQWARKPRVSSLHASEGSSVASRGAESSLTSYILSLFRIDQSITASTVESHGF
jgi:hypothetical protein